MAATGRTLGSATAANAGESPSILYVATSVTQVFFIATAPTLVSTLSLRIRVGSTSGTAQIFKVPSGTAVGSGVALTAATDISATPAADTVINMPFLSTVNGLPQLNPGDALGVVFAGTMTSGVGLIQAFVEPAF